MGAALLQWSCTLHRQLLIQETPNSQPSETTTEAGQAIYSLSKFLSTKFLFSLNQDNLTPLGISRQLMSEVFFGWRLPPALGGWRSFSSPKAPLSHVVLFRECFPCRVAVARRRFCRFTALPTDRMYIHYIIWHIFCCPADTANCLVEHTLRWTCQSRKQLITTSDFLEQLFPNSSLAKNN